jgi:thiaminase
MTIKKEINYRNNGAIGALLDEYERAINDLKNVINSLTNNELITLVNSKTQDEDCRSIQTILTHVIHSGYGYAVAVRKLQGEQLIRPNKDYLNTIEAYKITFDRMFEFNVQLFNDYPNVKLEELDNAKKVVFASGQVFDNEQLFEHAIVHILRNRRQIERFLLRFRLSQ